MKSRFEIYCEILYRGLLDIRNNGYAGNPDQCAKQADHLHNLPELLKNFDKEELHDFYWKCMRPEADTEEAKPFKELWKELEEAKCAKKVDNNKIVRTSFVGPDI
ncbi:hypothetical protein P3T73_07320 [Kiritimatiellota bacterium B12222]|nr:hypothetical protein P3T73_07320 [Kiritimatiellota bacterium B12222]